MNQPIKGESNELSQEEIGRVVNFFRLQESEPKPKPKPLPETVLGQQLKRLLNESGITNLKVEADGSISAQHSSTDGYPETSTIRNLRIEVKNGKLTIGGDITNRIADIGKVI